MILEKVKRDLREVFGLKNFWGIQPFLGCHKTYLPSILFLKLLGKCQKNIKVICLSNEKLWDLKDILWFYTRDI